MNRLFFVTIAALLVASTCADITKRHACYTELLSCMEDPNIQSVANNPYGASKGQACRAADLLLKCIKKCPSSAIDAAGLRKEVNDLENAHKSC